MALTCLALYLGRPLVSAALRFPDSLAYIDWPADFVLAGPQRVMGARPLGYALFLDVFGTGAALVWAQTVLSFAAWSTLGWLAGRLAGVALGCLLALVPSVWCWNSSVLSESFSLSLLALALAASLHLSQRAFRGRAPSWARLLGWALCLAFFGWSRDANLILVPALLLPALYLPLRQRVAVLAVAVLVLAVGALDARRNERADWSLNNAVLARVLPDPTAVARFAAAGMPVPAKLSEVAGSPGSRTQRRLRATEPRFFEWTERHGAREYWSWVLARPSSYVEAWRALERYYERDLAKYSHGLAPPRAARTAGAWMAFGPGPWATLLLPWLLLPALRRDRRIRAELAAALLFSATALVYSFLTYHADGVEMHRHMLLGIALQRVAFWIGVGVLVSTLCALLRARTVLASGSEAPR